MAKRKILSGDGRWMLHAPSGYQGKTYIGGRYVYEHRFMMEQRIGRLLRPGEVVHHINGDKLDNRLENLELTTVTAHNAHHATEKTKQLVEMLCPVCSSTFVRERRQTFLVKGGDLTTCSRKCGAVAGNRKKKGASLSTTVLRTFVG